MADVVRLLLENISIKSCLRGKFADGNTTAELLKDPSYGLVPTNPNYVPPKNKFDNDFPR